MILKCKDIISNYVCTLNHRDETHFSFVNPLRNPSIENQVTIQYNYK